MSKFVLIATDTAIETAIGKAKTQGATLQGAFHRIACSIVARMLESKDHNTCVRLTNAMIEALPGMARKNALRSWVEHFLGYTYNKETKAFVFVKREGFKVELADAIAAPFWDFKAEEEFKPIADWTKLIAGLVGRGLKDIEKLGENSKVNMEQLAILQKMVPTKSQQTKTH